MNSKEEEFHDGWNHKNGSGGIDGKDAMHETEKEDVHIIDNEDRRPLIFDGVAVIVNARVFVTQFYTNVSIYFGHFSHA